MAPKLSRKEASTSTYDESRFPDQATYNKFITTVSNRKLVTERVFDISEGVFPDIDRIINERGWHTLCREDPGPAVIPIVREFYAMVNSKQDKSVKIRGKKVDFTKAAINSHFKLPPVPVDEFNAFAIDEPNLDEVITSLCPYRTTWEDQLRIPRKDLSNKAKVWFYFVCARLIPALHRSDVTKDRAIMIHCILTGKAIDVGSVIHDMIMHAEKTKGLSLPFPSLITNLCRTAGVQWDASEEQLQLEAPINHRMIRRLNSPAERDAPTSEAATFEPTPPTPESSQPQPGPSLTVEARLAAVESSLLDHRQEFQHFRAYQVECNQSLHQLMQQCAISMGITPSHSVPWPYHPVPPHSPVQDEDDNN